MRFYHNVTINFLQYPWRYGFSSLLPEVKRSGEGLHSLNLSCEWYAACINASRLDKNNGVCKKSRRIKEFLIRHMPDEENTLDPSRREIRHDAQRIFT
jgi:hypothetical protein